MIRFFRSLFPSRWVVLVLLFLLIRLPLLFFGLPATLTELHHVLLGERLHGGFIMYQDVYDTTAPLAAGLYKWLDALFGKSYLAHRLVALVLTIYQAFLLNYIFNRNQVHPQKSFLPALFYLVFSSVFFEMDVLSPVLLGHTFVLLGVYSLTAISKDGSNAQRLFKAGFMLGLAALCYLPLIWFLVLGFLAIIYFASSAFRSTLLLITGFVFPFSVVVTYFLYRDSLMPFLELGLAWSWQFRFTFVLPFIQVLKVGAIPLGVLALSLITLPLVNLGLNYQARFLQFVLIWLIVVGLVLVSGHDGSAKGLILFMPIIGYFGVFLFTQWTGKKVLINEVFFLVLLAGTLFMRYNPLGLVYSALAIEPDLIQVRELPKYQQVQNERILVLGPDLNYYQQNSLGSPYLRWDLAQPYFNNLARYDALFTIYQDLRKAPPAYIIDQKSLMPELQYKLPALFNRYKREGNSLVYKLVR
ncbi:hypothetical protein GU926_11630 [Nibribacter ruber]|uniref:Glycosyltransferase RgtA/B/C/D-like domain-containing protein n=1 Tax=Nibribacter ruber TaxID=2698458 RepID=A0A6P1NW33_9BACT|nr:hypothetical protein [Nibribacter ruber]QHL88046.1 hypothetical protein GU926_11630 [Nibribacter ruber]